MQQNRWIPWATVLGMLGGPRARASPEVLPTLASHSSLEMLERALNLLRTLEEPSIRSGGKSLAQGQVALIDPT